MQQRGHASNFNDVFAPDRRDGFFLRISAYSAEVEAFLLRFYEAARRNGVIVEGRIPNPTDSNLTYFYEMLGQDFQLRADFLSAKLEKWLPRMNSRQRETIAASLFAMLRRMADGGKTESILKNAYIRFMCWLYFKFERIAVQLGGSELPKVLYQGAPSSFELQFLSILCGAGCDVALVLCAGEADYRKLDPQSELSDVLPVSGAASFPPNFSVTELYKRHASSTASQQPPASQQSTAAQPRRPGVQFHSPAPQQTSASQQSPAAQPRRSGVQFHSPAPQQTSAPQQPSVPWPQHSGAQSRAAQPALKLPEPDFVVCTNAWITGGSLESVATPHRARGTDEKLIYNCFIRINGVEDRLTYPNELIQLHQRLTESNRKLVILEDGIPQPTPDEIAKVRRGNYATPLAAIENLAANLRSGTRIELHTTLTRAFLEVMQGELDKPGANVNRITNAAVYLLCWFQRYYPLLLGNWQRHALGCLILLGGSLGEREALFLRMLARTPVDVLVLNPSLEADFRLEDPLLFEQSFSDSLALRRFPRESGEMRVRTAASQAERELDGVLYGDTGMYRNRQFDLAQSVTLITTYEEIGIYWDQELRYRPNFSAGNETVTMPVIFAQASGVKDGRLDAYWQEIKRLITPNTYLVRGLPFIQPTERNAFTGSAVDFFRNGQLQREKLRAHREYPFALLREEVQEHILNKLQVLIDQKLIRGTFENGTEYQIIATVLNIRKELVRLIQQFDFTKKNPKLLCVHTGEAAASKQDAILLAFLNLIGFDVMCYVPTGYQCFSQWYAANPIEEHQLGGYMYDLRVPDFNSIQNTHSVWRIFKRGS